ncbi:MAG: imidazole glycerol phosphate synthase subunit HisH, partial [Ostreibacterium sp.]
PLKIPHMGWNQIKHSQDHPLWNNIPNHSRFYFVHSYYLVPENTQFVVGTCDYGQIFAASLARDNIFTTQCHPEKSATVGLQLFKNFIHWTI